jgi:hypothetical protein
MSGAPDVSLQQAGDRLASRPFLAMSFLILGSTPLLIEGRVTTALGFLVYYGGYAVVSILAGGGSRFPDEHMGLVNLAIAGVNVGTFAVVALLVRIPVRARPPRVRWLVSGALAILYLAFLLLFGESPWWI